MEENKEKGSVMEKIAQFIVDKRNLFFLIYIAVLIFSVVAMNWKSVETDVTVYLNEESETRQGITTMNEHFAMFSTARVMVSNVTYEEAKELYEQITEVEGVTMVDFANTSEYYKDANALMSITFDGADLEERTMTSLANVKEVLAGYDYVADTTANYDQVAELNQQMIEIMGYAVVVIFLALTLTSTAYMEVPVLGMTFGAAILMGMGTNFLLGKISFISDSVAMLLQLAMGIDYAIILAHRFSAERELYEPREACIKALSKAIPEVIASSLTTIGGLLALSFMDFGIGMDLAVVLIKGVLLILLSVFTLMPGLLMLFSPWIDKTKHKKLLPDVSFIGKFCVKFRWIITPIFVVVLIGAFILSNACPFTYTTNSSRLDNMDERQSAYFKINDTFGTSNMVAILVPTGNYEAEAKILSELSQCEGVKSTMGLANTELVDGIMLTDSLNAREFSEALGIEYDIVETLFAVYAVDQGQVGKLVSMDTYRVPVFDLVCYLKDMIESSSLELEGEMGDMLSMLSMLDMAKEQLQTEEYSRMVVYLDLPEEGEDTYAFLDEVHQIADKYYDNPVYAIGNSTSCRDLGSTFATDNILITILSIVFVIIVLLFTFKSAGLPVLLVIVIQGSIWINFSFPTLQQEPLYFLGYLIVQSIQMGANIDYAIVISSHFNEQKEYMPVKEAVCAAINKAFPTILTSGSIMACMGFLLGAISTSPVNAIMGLCIGRGTVISMILVLFVLPCILVIGNKIIDATSFQMKGVDVSEYEDMGIMRVKGRIHGYVEGVIDGEVDAIVHGRVHAAIVSGNLGVDMIEADENAVEKAKKEFLSEDLKNRIGMFLLILCIVSSNVSMTVLAEESQKVEIPANAIYLETPEDVITLAENCISDVWSQDKTIVLKNDINMSCTGFEGIPTFGGTFLGQGHTISGYYLTQQQNAAGFFRYLQKDAVVEDLHLKGLIEPAKGDNLDIGGIAGVNRGKIKNCSFEGTISGTERIGGIAGQNKVTGIIEECTVNGIVYGDHYVGGVAGDNAGVIRNCKNYAEINTHVSHNSVSIGVTSLDISNIKESVRDATNLGGIAGTSSGVIRSCENHAAVGYEKMGYNVGGIAGSQIGYITNSVNYGTIQGSDGVGGIVGQCKPNVVLNMGENYMSTLMTQMTDMMSSMTGMMGSMDGMMGGMSIDMGNMEDSMDMLKDAENLDEDSLNAAVNEMSSSFNEMYQGMVNSGNTMTSSMNEMMGSMEDMVNTMEKLNEGLNIQIIDISKNDTSKDTVAKVNKCSNYGTVYGETYVGGIAGIADIEDTSAAEEAEGQLSFSTEGEMIMRLVVRDCRNTGTISATKEYAGGLVGDMVIGAIFDGKNIGSVDALNADYVGGIVGSSETYVKSCISRSILAGDLYVGGIAGFGNEVLDCYAITDIAAANKFAGGILGYANVLPDDEEGLISNNYYYLTGKNLGGIDGISYAKATEPITIEKFLAVSKLDEMFKTVNIQFHVDGQEDVVLNVGLGETLDMAAIPTLDVDEHEQYHWKFCSSVTAATLSMGEIAEEQYISQELLTNILFDQSYEAMFDAKNTVIAAEGKKVLAIGMFDSQTTVSVTDITEQEPTVNGVEILEASRVEISGNGIEKLHYCVPEGVEAEKLTLYIKDNSGNWTEREFAIEGSYIIFAFSDGEEAVALELTAEGMNLAVAGAASASALAVIAVVLKAVKKINKKESASE